jgi:hypothetical protein
VVSNSDNDAKKEWAMATRRTTSNAAATLTRGSSSTKVTAPAGKAAALAPIGKNAKATKTSDYESARQLLSRYCTLIDKGKLVELSELFHPNAKFSVSFDSVPIHTGREAILVWYTRFFNSRPGPVRHPRHKIFEPDLVVSGNSATASTYFDSDFVEPNDDVTILAGRYDDVLTRVRGRWLFMERSITICYHYSPGKSGDGMKM